MLSDIPGIDLAHPDPHPSSSKLRDESSGGHNCFILPASSMDVMLVPPSHARHGGRGKDVRGGNNPESPGASATWIGDRMTPVVPGAQAPSMTSGHPKAVMRVVRDHYLPSRSPETDRGQPDGDALLQTP